jgi:tryptophan halogenase
LNSKRRIIVAGTGLSAWMAAATLAEALARDDFSIVVVGPDAVTDEFASFGQADATLATNDVFHDTLARDESRIVRETEGSFTLGIALGGWSQVEATYFHPFSSIGASLGPLPFHQIATKLRLDGVPVKLANYALAALAAQAGRIAEPGHDNHNVQSTCEHGLHVDCVRLAGFLRRAALASGVSHLEETIQTVHRRTDGAIDSLTLENAARLDGDLFLDASGVEAVLADPSHAADWQDCSTWLPCDRIAAATIGSEQAPAPYSYAEANRGGWIRHLPLQGRTALTAFYNGKALSDDNARDLLRASAPGQTLSAIRFQTVRLGCRRQPWFRNCVALGMAAAAIDPIGVSNLQLLRASIKRLLFLLPGSTDASAESAEFNRQSALQFNHARDFAMLHYKLNGRRGEAFWDACREMPIPDSLQYRIELYAGRGRVVQYDEEPVRDSSWINLFDEHGVRPRHYNPIADGFDNATLREHANRVRTVMLEELGKMPAHADYLSRPGRSSR